jgi:Tfp pilus assembly protein PilF
VPIALALAAVAPLASRLGPRASRAALALALLAAMTLGARTYARASQWADEVALWSATAAEAPWSPVAAGELAAALERAGRREDAVEQYRRAATLADGSGRIAALKNYALALADVGRLDEATMELRATLQLAAPSAVDHYNLGVLELRRGNLDVARAELERAAALAPGNGPVLAALRAVEERRRVTAPAPPAPR